MQSRRVQRGVFFEHEDPLDQSGLHCRLINTSHAIVGRITGRSGKKKRSLVNMGDLLKGIFYAQFDNVLGPRVAFQHPAGYVFTDDSAIRISSRPC